jgi:hypothetical protein
MRKDGLIRGDGPDEIVLLLLGLPLVLPTSVTRSDKKFEPRSFCKR